MTRDLLRWQFDLTWSLTELHLDRLTPDDFLWEPAPRCWTLRQDTTGAWTPDWADTEPDPIPVPTIGWVTWHLGWWWTVAIDHAESREPRDRTAVAWPGPGPAAVDWLRDLYTDWLAVLDRLTDADLAAPAPFPWPPDAGMSVAQMLAWANAELMKNTAELGQLRLLRAALMPTPQARPPVSMAGRAAEPAGGRARAPRAGSPPGRGPLGPGR